MDPQFSGQRNEIANSGDKADSDTVIFRVLCNCRRYTVQIFEKNLLTKVQYLCTIHLIFAITAYVQASSNTLFQSYLCLFFAFPSFSCTDRLQLLR